ncbi:tRNA (N6-isopentenyl adenosine(37)-C2)-methylthiotransferase MiaB [Aestuariivirga litoralis]|uniref:tRNA-2-methylthio-N(6)-dimethylallyladenosine synthase n=1 Tax=Aestuariivirga litoralis TaxID=2650924 RepID=A0A2W2BNV2_9HYPH|nr:tRNA (N6-isopentenyl adenosine(37)-C2)-methylthiotransferase MiaB [Aestuariivirga litoralis]PZF77477.1 tRNA (N6-isopentenyl adenosine(37)-C2)-methylthiotransferase MiaB [Aestuariivirga litoralis]
MDTAPKKVFVRTYGCQMNVYDSERMRDVLGPLGYAETAVPEEADLVILNTCHIREKAAEKVYSELGKIRRMKRERAELGAEMLIAVAGCVAQAEGEEIVRRAPAVDLVFGPQTYHRLPQLLARRKEGGRAVVETEFPAEDKFERLDDNVLPRKSVAAFLTVQEGCDKFCSFCVVPYTRGSEFSRPVEQVVAEARRLATRGVKELTLLGQNVNAYHGLDGQGRSIGLAGLVAELSRIDGIERLRYTTSHPRDMTDDLIAAHAENSKLMPYLHLPVQSGSDSILKSMNRGHTTEFYIRLVEEIRAARPDIALSGDFIVGFPGETDDDFESTLNLVREVGYASAFSFKYSSRPGTPAAESNKQISEKEKSARLQDLQALIHAQQTAFNEAMVGRSVPVLLEKPGRDPGQLVGRSPYLQSVHLQADLSLIGTIVDTHISGVGTNSLSGHYPHAV